MEFPRPRFSKEFPLSAKDLLKELEKSSARNFSSKTGGGGTGSSASGGLDSRYLRDLQSSIDEHLFCLVDMKGTFTRRLTKVQELQLLDILVDFFAEKSAPAQSSAAQQGAATGAAISGAEAKNAAFAQFQMLFCAQSERDKGLSDARLDVLVRLVSLAVQLKCSPLLNHVAQWTQRHLQTKPPSPHMLNIADQLINDFCRSDHVTDTDLSSYLIDVIKDAPNFAAVVTLLMLEKYELGQFPPLALIRIFGEWLSTNTKIFLKNLRSADSSAGKNANWVKMFSQNFSKLTVLCILQPISAGKSDFFGSSGENPFEKLHYGIIQTILLCAKSNIDAAKFLTVRQINFCMKQVDEYRRRGKIAAADSSAAAEEPIIRSTAEAEVSASARKNPQQQVFSDIDRINDCLDRLIQITQIGWHCKCISGTKKELDVDLIADMADMSENIHLLSFVLSQLPL